MGTISRIVPGLGTGLLAAGQGHSGLWSLYPKSLSRRSAC
jgi:hypothetical protein